LASSCFNSGNTQAVAYVSSDSAIVESQNYVDNPNYITGAICPKPGLRLVKENPGSSCFENGACSFTCTPFANATFCAVSQQGQPSLTPSVFSEAPSGPPSSAPTPTASPTKLSVAPSKKPAVSIRPSVSPTLKPSSQPAALSRLPSQSPSGSAPPTPTGRPSIFLPAPSVVPSSAVPSVRPAASQAPSFRPSSSSHIVPTRTPRPCISHSPSQISSPSRRPFDTNVPVDTFVPSSITPTRTITATPTIEPTCFSLPPHPPQPTMIPTFSNTITPAVSVTPTVKSPATGLPSPQPTFGKNCNCEFYWKTWGWPTLQPVSSPSRQWTNNPQVAISLEWSGFPAPSWSPKGLIPKSKGKRKLQPPKIPPLPKNKKGFKGGGPGGNPSVPLYYSWDECYYYCQWLWKKNHSWVNGQGNSNGGWSKGSGTNSGGSQGSSSGMFGG